MNMNNENVAVKCGCFQGTIGDFEQKVKKLIATINMQEFTKRRLKWQK